jgi:predicted PurR-regulated permease PerM
MTPSSASPPPSSGPPSPLLEPDLQRLLRIIAWMLILGGGICALIVSWPLLSRIITILLPFLAAFVLAYVFDPIVTFVQVRLRLNRVAGLVVLYLLILGVLVGFFALLVPALYHQVTRGIVEFQSSVPPRVEKFMESRGIQPGELQSRLDDWLTSQGLTLEEAVWQAGKQPGVREAAQTLAGGGISVLGAGLRQVYLFLVSIFSGAMFAFLVIIVNFYLVLDFARFRRAFLPLVPDAWQDRSLRVAQKLDSAVGGFLRGQIINCVLIGALTTVGLMVLGMKQYALLIGFVAGAANFIPYLGPLMGEIPAILYVLLSNNYEGPKEKLLYTGLVIGLFALIQTLDGFVFQPKIVGKSAQLHPVVVILALVVGGQFGIMGMIVAVPTACILRVLIKEFYWDQRMASTRQREKAS